MTADSSPLLALPEAVLREVVSWSPDGATANALLATCQASHQQRRDPATAALLLLRCPCQDYMAALASCAETCGGVAAVVQQVLQLTEATPDCGGPLAAPPPLLEAALVASAAAGDEDTIRALLASHQPPNLPNLSPAGSRAAVTAMQFGHVAALQALLECGADPYAHDLDVFYITNAQALPAFQLMLRHCPAGRRTEAVECAVDTSIISQNVAVLEHLLSLPEVAHIAWGVSLAQSAAYSGSLACLKMILELTICSEEHLSLGLMEAAEKGSVAFATLLLDHGAGANGGAQVSLQHAFEASLTHRVAEGPEEVHDPAAAGRLRDVVGLLLRHGAAATPAVRAAAEAAGHGGMLAAVVVEVLAADGA